MKEKKLEIEAPVYRITIDEKLDDNLIRILKCGLKNGLKEFRDEINNWNEEEEDYIQKDSYIKKMDIAPLFIKDWPWEKLQEGQVFLSGKFEIINNKICRFIVSLRKKNFYRIDEMVRKQIEPLYFKLLQRK